jgi:hypothetical protein
MFGKEPSGLYAHTTFASMGIFGEVLKLAKSLSTEDIIAAAYEVDIPEFTTMSGWGAKFEDIAETGDFCTNTRSIVYMVQWNDGKLEVAFPAQAAVNDPVIPKPDF